MKNIRRLSTILIFVFATILVLLPIYVAVYWLTNGYALDPYHAIQIFLYAGPPLPPIWTLPTVIKVYGFLINLVPVSLYMLILANLIKLFNYFRQGEILSPSIVILFRRIAWFLLVTQLIRPLYNFFILYALNFAKPPAYRYFYIGINFQDFILISVSAIVLLISWIFSEYYKINQEQEFTV